MIFKVPFVKRYSSCSHVFSMLFYVAAASRNRCPLIDFCMSKVVADVIILVQDVTLKGTHSVRDCSCVGCWALTFLTVGFVVCLPSYTVVCREKIKAMNRFLS